MWRNALAMNSNCFRQPIPGQTALSGIRRGLVPATVASIAALVSTALPAGPSAAAAAAPALAPRSISAAASWATGGDRQLYVSPAGNDDNPGTKARPFRQITRAAEEAEPGTVVHVATGTYDEVYSLKSGESSRPITFISDVEGGARVVQGTSRPAWWNDAEHVDIVGFDVTAPQSYAGILNLGSHVRVINNHVHDVFTAGPCYGGAGIVHELYTGTGNATIGNTVHQVGAVGCSLAHGVYVTNSDSVVQDNLVYDVAGWLLHFYHAADRGDVTGNIVFAGNTERGQQADGGIVLCAKEGNTVPADNFTVSRNVIRDVPVGLKECGEMNVNVGPNNRFRDNIVFNTSTPVSVMNPVSGTITADPKLVNFKADGSGDYRFTASSFSR
jgi:pectate disaccharide-lyase